MNKGAWEMVVHDLAVMCGLDVPEARLENYSRNGSTFLIKRFDRAGTQRIHYSSAMTMLGRTDGAHAADGAGYLDLVSFIKQYGAAPKKDLQELWRRIVFNMAVSNTDDHLRNHGFLLLKEGWRLSPVFDVNPDADGDVLSLNVDETNNLIDFELAASVASMYEIPVQQVRTTINDIKAIVVEHWKKLANQYGISRSEIEYMTPAFDMRFK